MMKLDRDEESQSDETDDSDQEPDAGHGQGPQVVSAAPQYYPIDSMLPANVPVVREIDGVELTTLRSACREHVNKLFSPNLSFRKQSATVKMDIACYLVRAYVFRSFVVMIV
jgi:hypothetical protein